MSVITAKLLSSNLLVNQFRLVFCFQCLVFVFGVWFLVFSLAVFSLVFVFLFLSVVFGVWLLLFGFCVWRLVCAGLCLVFRLWCLGVWCLGFGLMFLWFCSCFSFCSSLLKGLC